MNHEVAAFYGHGGITLPNDHSPTVFTSSLIHEHGHGLDELGFYEFGWILTGNEVLTSSLELSRAKANWLRELFKTDQPGESWQLEVQEIVSRIINKLTKGKYDPSMLEIEVLGREEFNMLVTVIMGINQSLKQTVQSPATIDQKMLKYEIPGYYLEHAGSTLIKASIGIESSEQFSTFAPLKTASLTHQTAYQEAQRLLKHNEYPW